MSDNILNHADAMAEYDPWADNEEAHTVLQQCVQQIAERLYVLETMVNDLSQRVAKIENK